MAAEGEFTRLLSDLSEGRKGAEDALLRLVYDELRVMAHRYMQDERSGHTLQTTALVHEAYLKIGGVEDAWENKAHYLRAAAQAMRRILIDHARRKRSFKQGGGRKREPLDQAAVSLDDFAVDLIALDNALQKLSELDPKLEQVVELRFFGGLTADETARVLGVTPRTVKYDWRMAKAWLKQEMEK